MAYEKLNLPNGATLDAGHLAHMEQGIADALPATELDAAIETALATAKESGEFDGADGADGYTPQKGTDYWTDADKLEMVNEVLAALPVYAGEVEDA